MSLPYSEIVRELLAAKKAIQHVIVLTEEDRLFRIAAQDIKSTIESFQDCLEHQEALEDPDGEEDERP